MSKILFENLRGLDLEKMVKNEIHVDEYKSKMGNDDDIVVLSFKVRGKDPANDLVGFLEKGYNFVLDADTSSGEMEDGDYLVFVELKRSSKVVPEILVILEELENLTGIPCLDNRIVYGRDDTSYPVTKENLRKLIPLSPHDYRKKFPKNDIKGLKAAAGIDSNETAPINDFTESLRILGGIK